MLIFFARGGGEGSYCEVSATLASRSPTVSNSPINNKVVCSNIQ